MWMYIKVDRIITGYVESDLILQKYEYKAESICLNITII
jgi:hypothetical protein